LLWKDIKKIARELDPDQFRQHSPPFYLRLSRREKEKLSVFLRFQSTGIIILKAAAKGIEGRLYFLAKSCVFY
jgi:hypothetical protein